MTEQISLGVELHDEEEIEITFDIIRVVCKDFVENLPILKGILLCEESSLANEITLCERKQPFSKGSAFAKGTIICEENRSRPFNN